MLPVLAEHGARAKIRMGGVTTESVPAVDVVARFLLACVRERVAWKATAGLHHAVRGVRELTPGGPRAPMHGFVNLFLAGALAFYGAEERAVVKTLEEQDAGAFRLDDDVLRWHDNTMIADQLEKARNEFAICFGSCSFDGAGGRREGDGMVVRAGGDPPARSASWVESANDPEGDFPLENLPFGLYEDDRQRRHTCIAIGDQVLDLLGCNVAGLLNATQIVGAGSARAWAIWNRGGRGRFAIVRRSC